MDILSRWDEVYLLAIRELHDNAYGVTIKKKVSEMSGKLISYGGLYFALDQLVKKGYVNKTAGGSTAKRGGRTKFYYTLTETGTEALKTTYRHQRALWKGIEGYAAD